MAQYQRTQQEALLAQATRDYLAAESALKQHVVDGQQALKQQLAQRFEAQLDTALRTQVQQLQAEYEQEMAARLRDLEGFARKQVKQLQNEEALQRLRRLDYLAHKVKVLEVSALHASDVLYSQHRIHLMLTAIRVLRETLDGPAAVVDLQTHLRALSELSDGDGFVRALLPAFRPVLPTPSSLKDGFPNVASHVRQAAYMPPNGGPLSYAISAALSAITAHKTGLIPGTDVEAIVARAEYYLARNELERSARELNQLSGWPRRLADGWLCRARALLEAQQTAGAIEDHLIYSSLDV
ncbi:hypothetical protein CAUPRSCDRAFT_7163 [Caulochytrium protostelioides]|nr:hypothetical protein CAUPRSCDRAFT_7163 [Caulochytrium protostelioides]